MGAVRAAAALQRMQQTAAIADLNVLCSVRVNQAYYAILRNSDLLPSHSIPSYSLSFYLLYFPICLFFSLRSHFFLFFFLLFSFHRIIFSQVFFFLNLPDNRDSFGKSAEVALMLRKSRKFRWLDWIVYRILCVIYFEKLLIMLRIIILIWFHLIFFSF